MAAGLLDNAGIPCLIQSTEGILHGARWLGAITPIGGVCLLAGWGALCWSLISRPKMDARTGDSTSWTHGG